jgi:hypothetical protein
MASPTGTYSGDPTTSPLDEVRFLIGDTGWNGLPWQLADAEISYQFIVSYGYNQPIPPYGNYLPAAYCADAIAARYKMLVDKAVGDLHISYSQFIKQFQEIAARLRSRAAIWNVQVFSGGLSVAQKRANALNWNITHGAIVIDGMNDGYPTPQVSGRSGSDVV